MNRKAAQRKRDRAIKLMRAAEMTEDEIQAALAEHKLDDASLAEANIIDVEVISVDCEETKNLPALIEKPWNDIGMENQFRQKREYEAKPNRTPDGRSTDAENVAAYNDSLANNTERRCSATNTYGERCRRYAIQGSTVCKTHFGSTGHIVHKARERVEKASNKLMGKLIEFAFDDDKPPGVQLDAIKDSLNRAGLKPRETVEFGISKPFEEIFQDLEFGTMTRAESRAARGLEPNSAVPQANNSTAPASNQQSDNVIGEYDGPKAPQRQGNSSAQEQTGPINSADRYRDSGAANRQNDLRADLSDPTDIPSPAHRQGAKRQRERNSGPVIEGEAAIALANAVNAATGALRATEGRRD